jgi:alpha 1,3-glucosidase
MAHKQPQMILLCLVLCLCCLIPEAVDRSKFRKCSDTGFCRRHRANADNHALASSGYKLDVASFVQSTAGVYNGILNGPLDSKLNLAVSAVEGGALRVKINEEADRWAPTDLLMPGATTVRPLAKQSLDDAKVPSVVKEQAKTSPDVIALSFGDFEESLLVIDPSSLTIDMYHQGVLQVQANGRNMMHYEQTGAHGSLVSQGRSLAEDDRHGGKEVVDYGEDGLAMYADGSREERRVLSEQADPTAMDGDNFGGHKVSLLDLFVGCSDAQHSNI